MATSRFTITAGFLVRDEIKRQITRQAFELGIDIKIEEQKSLLSSELYITLEGESDKVNRLTNAVKNVIGTE